MKICRKCGLEKDESEFNIRTDTGRINGRCKKCASNAAKYSRKTKIGQVDDRIFARARLVDAIKFISHHDNYIDREYILSLLNDLLLSHDLSLKKTIDLFWSKVDKSRGDESCWIWNGNKGYFGHGMFPFRGKNYGAHRFSYMLANGSIPEGLVVCHKCDNPSCVNHKHLFIGTQADNNRDKIMKGRFPKENPRIRGLVNGGRVLDPDKVKEIRSLRESMTIQAIADEFGVTNKTISNIFSGRSWSRIK